MLTLEFTTQFKKDAKRMEKRRKNMAKLHHIVETLRTQEILPARNRNHKLTGNWAGHWECHIESDWLLVYELNETMIILTRTGTHSDLFA